jgi:hypothetical protein
MLPPPLEVAEVDFQEAHARALKSVRHSLKASALKGQESERFQKL